MKRNLLSIRAAILALGALGALALPTLSTAATFSLNNTLTCNSVDGGMSMDPAGNLTINCTVVTAGATTTAPVCSVSTSPGTITAGGTSTVSASCNPAATSYVWTTSSLAPAISGSSQQLTFATAGTYTYQVAGTNTIGQGALSAAGTVQVNAAIAAAPGSCTTTAVNGQFVGKVMQVYPVISRGGSASYAMEVYSAPGANITLSTAPGGTNAVGNLWTELALSTCPGDFNVPAECRVNGIADAMQMSLSATAAAVPGQCVVVVGQQYYINVRNVYNDNLTPSCSGNCSLLLQMNWY